MPAATKMGHHYDAITKELIELSPIDWLAFYGQVRQPTQVRLVDADLSTVSAEADKVAIIDDPQPWIMHMEFQSSWDGELVRRVQRYNAMLQERHRCDVSSVVVLLRKQADSPRFTGSATIKPAIGPKWSFKYHLVRVRQ
jgi:hypothetical protein